MKFTIQEHGGWEYLRKIFQITKLNCFSSQPVTVEFPLIKNNKNK